MVSRRPAKRQNSCRGVVPVPEQLRLSRPSFAFDVASQDASNESRFSSVSSEMAEIEPLEHKKVYIVIMFQNSSLRLRGYEMFSL